VKWLVVAAFAYVTLMLFALGTVQWLSRAHSLPTAEYVGPTGLYTLRVSRDLPLPFGFGGRGSAPGQVQTIDSRGQVLDARDVPDAYGVFNVRWEAYKVDFDYRDGSQIYQTALALAQ
jgi:hypothetical protein